MKFQGSSGLLGEVIDRNGNETKLTYPRIGENAAEELRRGRKIVLFGIATPAFAIAAGLLIGTGTFNDVIGVALAAVVVAWYTPLSPPEVEVSTLCHLRPGVRPKGQCR
jgi:hypothetical protein